MQSVRLANDCLDSARVPFGWWHRQCHLPSGSDVKSQSSMCFMKNTASAFDVPEAKQLAHPPWRCGCTVTVVGLDRAVFGEDIATVQPKLLALLAARRWPTWKSSSSTTTSSA